jgi:hypothetical protein
LEAKPHSPVDALISGNACRDAAQAQFFNAGGQGIGIAQKLSIAIPDADLGNGQFRHERAPALRNALVS